MVMTDAGDVITKLLELLDETEDAVPFDRRELLCECPSCSSRRDAGGNVDNCERRAFLLEAEMLGHQLQRVALLGDPP